jgi:UDP-glucuronate decarboxylase
MKIYTDDDINNILTNLGDLAYSGKRVLVTGGAGFLGSWICTILVQQGACVTCLDNLSSGRKENVAHLDVEKRFEFKKHDISIPPVLHEKFDYILHLASRASPFEFNTHPLEILRANTFGLVNALDIAKRDGARLLFTSTSEVYGKATVFPTPETYPGVVNINGIRGCYDEAKRAGEAFCMAYLREHGVDIRIARIFNTYGPGMRADGIYGRVVPRFISQALKNEPITIFGDGSQTRSFCYVTDQVEGLLRLAASDSAGGNVVNIGNDREVPVLQLAHIIREITGSQSGMVFSPLPEDDPQRRWPDITRAKELLGWKPKVDLEEGIGKMVESC